MNPEHILIGATLALATLAAFACGLYCLDTAVRVRRELLVVSLALSALLLLSVGVVAGYFALAFILGWVRP